MVSGNCIGTLTRVDGSSWLDDGFLEGQLFQINGSGPLYKIQALTGTTVDQGRHPRGHRGDVQPDHRRRDRRACRSRHRRLRRDPHRSGRRTTVTFTTANWYVPVAIPVVADPYYNVPAGNANLLVFPKVPHLLSSIKGPLVGRGRPTPATTTRRCSTAVMLPHETDALPFGIGVQPPEAQQVNVLNIFDDGSQQDQTGTLSSTNLNGFGMGPGLDFTNHKGYVPGDPHHPTFGEPPVFPSGISFGSITIDSHGSVPDQREPVDDPGAEPDDGPGQRPPDGHRQPGSGPFSNNDGTRPRPMARRSTRSSTAA